MYVVTRYRNYLQISLKITREHATWNYQKIRDGYCRASKECRLYDRTYTYSITLHEYQYTYVHDNYAHVHNCATVRLST